MRKENGLFRGIAALCATVLCVIGACTEAWAQLPAMFPDGEAGSGAVISMPLTLGDASGWGVVSAEMVVTYDPEVAGLSAVRAGEMAAGWNVQHNVVSGAGAVDTVKIAMNTATDTLSGSGEFFVLEFQCTDAPGEWGSVSGLAFVKMLFNQGEPLAQTQDGSITVYGPPAAPTGFKAVAYRDSVRLDWNANTEANLSAYTIYRGTSSPASTLLDSVVAQSSPDSCYVDISVVTGTTYYYRIKAVGDPGGQSGFSGEVRVTPWPYGDVSGNGEVLAYDATLILQQTADIITLPSTYWPRFTLEVADVSGDGTIAPYDASLVLRHVVDLIPEFPTASEKEVASSPRQVGFASAELQPDGSFVVPIVIDDIGGVFSGQLEMAFDPAFCRAVKVNKGEALGGYMFASNILEATVLISFAGTGSGDGGGRLAEVIFESVGSNGTDILSGIRLSKAQLNEGRLVVVSAAEMEEQRLPVGFGLTQNWPNPFNGSTTIRFDLMQGSEVGLTIYNLSGQRIRTLVDGFREAGSHAVRWDGKDGLGRAVASGVYLVRMEAVDFAGVKRMVMLR